MVNLVRLDAAAAPVKQGNPIYTIIILVVLISVIVLVVRSVRKAQARRNEPRVLPPELFLSPRRPVQERVAPEPVPSQKLASGDQPTPRPVRRQGPTAPLARPPATVHSLAPGSKIADYKLVEQVGHGGMAVVFRAQDERLRRQVALKVLAPALSDDKDFRQRFVRESRAAAALDDPHIIPVFQAGRADGVLFIAMRYVSGGDVRTLLDREGQMAIARTVAIISPVASALDTAHAAGLIHRDVKPANILIDVRPRRPDHVYLSDFGIAKGTATIASLTGTGHFLGTLDYISPEQIAGKHVDGQTDQYALACTAFELLTATAPFRRSDAAAIIYAQLSEHPPYVTERRPDLPLAMNPVFEKALAKSPQDRFPTCADFADALRIAAGLSAYQSDDSSPAPPHPPTRIV